MLSGGRRGLDGHARRVRTLVWPRGRNLMASCIFDRDRRGRRNRLFDCFRPARCVDVVVVGWSAGFLRGANLRLGLLCPYTTLGRPVRT